MSEEVVVEKEGRGLTSIQVVASIIGVLVVAFVVFLATRDPQQTPVNNAVVGEAVPRVVGVSYDGSSFDIEETLLTNRTLPASEQVWVVLNFFASWCVQCEIEHSELVQFNEKGASCPTQLVGIAIRDSEKAVTDFFERRGGQWPVLVGENNRMIIDFSVTAPPETFVVAPSGLIIRKMVGPTTYDDLVGSIQC